MDMMLKISCVILVALFCALVLRKVVPEFSFLISLVAGVIVFVLLEGSLLEIIAKLQYLAEVSKIDSRLWSPILKTVGISMICKLTGEICRSAGEGGLASFVDLAGTILSIVIALPLMEGVMTLIVRML